MTEYRYTLTRHIEYDQPLPYDDCRLCWVMLNPSTADELVDDPTIRRVIRFTKDRRYTDLTVVNLFAARTTRPLHLLEMDDPVGPDNREWIETTFADSDEVVFAWGAWMSANWRRLPITSTPPYVGDLADKHGHEPLCLGVTANGSPRHPLYVPAAQPLVPYVTRTA